MERYLILEDGTVIRGLGFGYAGQSYGEIVFNTSMTGYIESITDPSYKNQILTFASPTIGNYPVWKSRMESNGPQVSGIVTRDAHAFLKTGSEWAEFNNFLSENGVPGIDLVDTRFLVRKIRENGVMRAYISPSPEVPDKFPDPMAEDVVSKVTCAESYEIFNNHRKNILYIDVGTKRSLIREVSAIANIFVVPHNYRFEATEYRYDAIFISNGPGDPSHESVDNVVNFLSKKAGEIPIYGVCLGHQLIARALGGRTSKMKFGHRGSNHAVTDGKKVIITSHNHGYAVDRESLENTDLKVIQWDINDGTVEMIRHQNLPVLSAQYHPEASPGPHEAREFFTRMKKEMEGN